MKARIIKQANAHAPAQIVTDERARAVLFDLRRRLFADIAAIDLALGIPPGSTEKPIARTHGRGVQSAGKTE